MLNICIISKTCVCLQYVKSISVDFYKTMQMEFLKIGLNNTLNFVRIKSVAHKLCISFGRALNPKLTNFWYYMNTHVLNIILFQKSVHVSSTFSRYL